MKKMSEMIFLEIFGAMLFAALTFAVIAGVFSFIPSSSQNYRKYLKNMYVASKIRNLAEEDELDLNKEHNLFKTFSRNQKVKEMDLDRTIEEDLKEKIGETYKKDKEKSKK